ncbi:MAG: hypothetical protein PUF36_04790 [Prevotella sp.]|nr:hypothetical protein [Prevotella sp.]
MIGFLRIKCLRGTVFQTVVCKSFYYPETSSRVTLAALGIGFQPNLVAISLYSV